MVTTKMREQSLIGINSQPFADALNGQDFAFTQGRLGSAFAQALSIEPIINYADEVSRNALKSMAIGQYGLGSLFIPKRTAVSIFFQAARKTYTLDLLSV